MTEAKTKRPPMGGPFEKLGQHVSEKQGQLALTLFAIAFEVDVSPSLVLFYAGGVQS
jgi:hypothetical protein